MTVNKSTFMKLINISPELHLRTGFIFIRQSVKIFIKSSEGFSNRLKHMVEEIEAS